MTSRRPARTGVLLLLSMGLWACAGCSPDGPADTREAELPAPAHCAPLGGDPLPSMCVPAGHLAGRAQGRVPHARAAHDGMPAPTVPARPDTGTAPAMPARPDIGTVPAGADAPVSPELMPEAPYSGWGLLGPWIPEPGAWREAEFADDPPPVLEHSLSGAVPAERPVVPGAFPVVPATVPDVEVAPIPVGAPAPDTIPQAPAEATAPLDAPLTIPAVEAVAPETSAPETLAPETSAPEIPVPETAVRDA